MRVIHVITRLIIGGAQENTLASVLGLRQKTEWDVRLISGPTRGPEGSLEDQAAAVPGMLLVLPSLVRPVHPWHDLFAWKQLTRHFRELQPTIVHTHSGKAGILGRLAARRARVPLVLHTIHGPSFGPYQGPVSNCLYRAAERLAGRVTNHFVTVADAMTQQYLHAGIGRDNQYTRILSGFDLKPYLESRQDYALRQRYGLGPEDLVVGKIARLFPLKGHDDLLAIARPLVSLWPSVRFLLVGDGVWRRRIENQVSALGLQRHFVFTGLVTPSEIPPLVGIMDILVHLSRREGLPRALAQALAAGRPVIAYDSDGAGEVCLDGETGYLVPIGDHNALTDRMIRLLCSVDLRHQMGAAGQRLVRTHFAVEKMVDDLAALYHRLMDERGLQIPAARKEQGVI
jgi:glycosyltransferase involved in cell wall biosynthesis